MKSFPHFPGRLYMAALCLMPLVAIFAPRFTGLGPPIIAGIAIAAYYFANKSLPQFSKRVLIWSLVFPVLMALSALWGIAPETSFARAYKTLPVALSAAVLWDFARVPNENDAAFFRKYFPIAVLLSSAILIFELYSQAPLYHMLHVLKHPEKEFNLSPLNRSVVVYILCALIAFFTLRADDFTARTKQILMLLLVFMTGMVLYATNSQSAQLGFVLAVIFYVAFPYRAKWAYGVLAAVLAALIIATPWLTQYMFHHFAPLSETYPMLKKGYAPYRMEVWDFVSRRALQRPWLGFGAEATRTIKDFDSAKIYWPSTQVLHPHNFAVQIWIEFGLLGAVITSLLFADLLRNIKKMDVSAARLALPLLMASISVAATGYGLWQAWWLGMFCLQIGYAGILLRPKA